MALVQRAAERLQRSNTLSTGANGAPEAPLGAAPRRRHPYDPRPDLEDPGRLWATVLATAYAAYGMSDVYTFLQGLRILECRLYVKPDGRLHLDVKPALEAGWAEAVLRQEWLLPRKEQIKDVFDRAEAILRGLPPGTRVPAWMRRVG